MQHYRAFGSGLQQAAPILGYHAFGFPVVQFAVLAAGAVADDDRQAGFGGARLPFAVRPAQPRPPGNRRHQHLGALVLQHGGDFVAVGIGADEDAGLDAAAVHRADFPAGRRPALGAAQGFHLAVPPDNPPARPDDEHAVIQPPGGGVPLRVRQKRRHPQPPGQRAEPLHPGVGLRQNPVGANQIHKQIAGNA